MRLTIALVIGLAAMPATAQRAPITKLLDKVPSLLGGGGEAAIDHHARNAGDCRADQGCGPYCSD